MAVNHIFPVYRRLLLLNYFRRDICGGMSPILLQLLLLVMLLHELQQNNQKVLSRRQQRRTIGIFRFQMRVLRSAFFLVIVGQLTGSFSDTVTIVIAQFVNNRDSS